MSETGHDNVVPIRRGESSLGRNGNGGGDDGPGDGKRTGERLAALETHAQTVRESLRDHMATKKDISDLKVWLVFTVMGGMALLATLLRMMLSG